ncbi:MAG: transposase [Actinomycetota bacterium]|nr:transposase [Actinomycetota bacterium]
MWVADSGFSSVENRRYLQRAGGHYIIGEKLMRGWLHPRRTQLG